jgi:hypothetical protein
LSPASRRSSPSCTFTGGGSWGNQVGSHAPNMTAQLDTLWMLQCVLLLVSANLWSSCANLWSNRMVLLMSSSMIDHLLVREGSPDYVQHLVQCEWGN